MASPTSQTTITPHNQTPLVTRTYVSQSELDDIVKRSSEAQKAWARVPLKDRLAIATKFVDEFQKMKDEIPLELTLQMGRPVSQIAGEIRGTLERAKYMLSIAESSLADVGLQDTDKPGFRRFIRRTPLGVVLVIAPWNFPYLTSINSVLPAIVAGNAVLLKPSPQTPLTAERLALALHRAGLPENVIQVLHLSPLSHYFQRAAVEAPGFKGVALELGGKDPAYVRADADLAYTVAELVDGAFFNSGQSCCAVEVRLIQTSFLGYRLGDPTKSETNLGPVVSLASAQRIRKQVKDAVEAGARALVPEELFLNPETGNLEGTAYVAPQVLVDVNHTMDVMMEETFGPIVGIQKVSGDEEATRLMNDSPYGLTASIWTNAEKDPESQNAFLRLVDELHTGTVFLNRCDYLDPALAWVGVKDSGRGISLSKFGYDQLTRAKSVHMKINTS
ncbi:succinate semialdehyde dehydrogenase [Lactarius akahatsu]|uniref:Succinate semialdehyde dehydrogenase n=1 Tax=Lactarius akahatsu TaxID=416441 RepID=A0AAD4LML6_9AGAM|nr:succinate semialdehyde dehydrogenase [Lactarius akahatsu]